MSTIEMVARDIFVRHTATDGNSFVQQHRVWDAERFMAARHADAAKLNGEVKGDAPRKAKAEQITEDQYRAERTTR